MLVTDTDRMLFSSAHSQSRHSHTSHFLLAPHRHQTRVPLPRSNMPHYALDVWLALWALLPVCWSVQLLPGVNNLPQLLSQTSLPSVTFHVYDPSPSSATINMTISYSLTGTGASQGIAVQQVSSLWVLNERGGVTVAGVTYNLSLVWIDDGSSVPRSRWCTRYTRRCRILTLCSRSGPLLTRCPSCDQRPLTTRRS